MVDALASGASVRKDVGVQVPPRAPLVEQQGPGRHDRGPACSPGRRPL